MLFYAIPQQLGKPIPLGEMIDFRMFKTSSST
jgi:hypothetical protein